MDITLTRCDSCDLSKDEHFVYIEERFVQFKNGLITVSELVHSVENVGYGIVSFTDSSIVIDQEVTTKKGISLLLNFTLTF